VNIPNTITVIRILLVPALIWFLFQKAFSAALAVFLVAGLSDALDGYLARRLGQMTRLGALLDPLADKLLVASSVLILAGSGRIPWWLAATIIARDFLILGAAASSLYAGRADIPPSMLSKANTCIQLAVIFFVLSGAGGILAVSPLLPPLFFLALATTLLSGAHYAVLWAKSLK
jgi:cardiolipin synthase (CMP-forming)